MGYRVRLTFSAEKDLRDIISFIGRENPAAAREVALGIRERMHLLKTFPLAGHPASDFKGRALREIVYSHYRVIYEVDSDGDHINIVRIWHGARGKPWIPRVKKKQ